MGFTLVLGDDLLQTCMSRKLKKSMSGGKNSFPIGMLGSMLFSIY